MRSPLGMEGPLACVHKAADAKTSCCSRLLTLLRTRHVLRIYLMTGATHAPLVPSQKHRFDLTAPHHTSNILYCTANVQRRHTFDACTWEARTWCCHVNMPNLVAAVVMVSMTIMLVVVMLMLAVCRVHMVLLTLRMLGMAVAALMAVVMSNAVVLVLMLGALRKG